MPRNDQVTRQWLLLRHLEASCGATLQEIAAALPPDLSKHHRTIRRDLDALEAAGFPLLTERVEGRVVWKLLEGTQLHAALDSALGKAASALPAPGHAYLQQLDGVLAVGFGPHVSYRTHRETIDKLTDAINRKRTVQMRYFSASRDATTRREVDPYRLWYANGALYLVGHCHLRGEVRLFAVERIRSCTPTDHAYQLPLHFDLEAYVQDALRVMRGGRPVTVELLFDKATAAWAKDRTWHPTQECVQEKDGRLRMMLKVAAIPELVGWILSFGDGVRVIGPPELRKGVQATAERICTRT